MILFNVHHPVSRSVVSIHRGGNLNLRPMTKSIPLILLIEDDPDDVEIFQEALQRADPAARLVHQPNGQEALRWLYLSEELPDLVVLDLNMPIMGGRETIPMMHKDPRLHSLPQNLPALTASIRGRI